MSPANEVPAPAGSGSGGALSNAAFAGVFNSANDTLQLAVGYGSSAGFADLTGPATTAAINGPAQTNQTAAALFDLAALTLPAINPTTGGTIVGSVVYGTNDVAGLLAGLDYLNIATSNNPAGEVRAQLIPLDLPPVLDCPAATNVPCGTAVTLSAGINDIVGNSVAVVWSLNGVAVQTNAVPAFVPPPPPPTSSSAPPCPPSRTR